jgi:hypothetical protein
MARRLAQMRPASAPAAAIEVELARIGAMNIDQLRAAWREVYASDPPPALTRAALTGLRKRGFSIERTREAGEASMYRIAPTPTSNRA